MCAKQHRIHDSYKHFQVHITIYIYIYIHTYTHRVIKKSLCTWWLQYRKLQVMFKVSHASLQAFIDVLNCVLEDRVQYSTIHILNVFCDGHLQIINCVGIVQIHWVFVHRDFLITLYMYIHTQNVFTVCRRLGMTVNITKQMLSNLKNFN
jgi:hypothetical protein